MAQPMPAEKPCALVVDDDEVFRTRLCRAFTARGWEALPAADAAVAIELAGEHSPDLAVVDLRIGSDNGIDVVRELRRLDSTCFLLMLTGWGSIATAVEAVRTGADHYLSKPVDVDQILAAHSARGQAAGPAETAVPSLARVEWEHIQRVLTDAGGNVSLAAKRLGIHRRSLQRKLSKYPPRV